MYARACVLLALGQDSFRLTLVFRSLETHEVLDEQAGSHGEVMRWREGQRYARIRFLFGGRC